MAITHTRTIENLRVLNDDNNIVCRVRVKWTSSDDSDVERTTIESSKAFKIETEGVTSESDGFISFESLTFSSLLFYQNVINISCVKCTMYNCK